MAHKTIRGGLTPGGRRRMEKMINLVLYERLEPGKLVTHKYHGFENMEKALLKMKDKDLDLIKPVVFVD
jgi:threonine dehydrogenase-like Zn-dependent dehydrogenase